MLDDYASATSFPHGHVDDTTMSSAVTRGHSATMQKAFLETSIEGKEKVRNMVRKREQRSDDDQHFTICESLGILDKSKNILVCRSEYLCIHLVHLVRGNDFFKHIVIVHAGVRPHIHGPGPMRSWTSENFLPRFAL
jgi:hypothetical protein